MAWHKIKTENGIMPRLDPRLLPDGYAQVAENVDLTKGAMKPYMSPSEAYTLPDALQKSIYRNYPLDNVLVCGAFGTTLANLKLITNGTFKISIEGIEYTVVAMDFSGITVMNDACAIIQAAIRVATGYYETVTYSATTGKFTISSKAKTISFLTAGETNVTGKTNNDIIPDMTSNTAPSGVCSASSVSTTDYAWKAADDDAATAWLAALNTLPSWWQYQATRKYVVSQFRFKIYSTGTYSPHDFSLLGSNNGTGWTTIQTFSNDNVTADAWTSYFEVAAANRHPYTYHRLNVTTVNGTGNYYVIFKEVEFNHAPVDLSGSGYLNGLTGGTALITTQYASEWLYWTEQNIKVAESPIFNDQYQRIYWTGASDGHMYVRGNFGTRRVYIEKPAQVTAAITSLLTFPGSVSGKLAVTVPTQSPVATVSLPDCTTSCETTPTGFLLKFYFAGGHVYQNQTGGAFLDYAFQILNLPGTGVPATLTVADVGNTYAQTSDGVVWATVEIVSITGAPKETRNTYIAAPFITQVWEPCVFTVEINMNYKDPVSDRYYVMRYVNDLGEDGQVSVISTMVIKKPTDKVVLTLPVSSDGTITKKRIFRTGTASDTVGDGTFFLAEVDNATTTYIDWLADKELNEKIEFRYSPPDGLQGLTAHPGGFLVAYKGKEVWSSDIGMPFSWNPSSVALIDSPVIGMGSSGSDIYALPVRSPYVLSGDSPSGYSVAKLPIDQGCTNCNSVKNVKSMVVYTSPDGVIGLTGGQGQVLTAQHFDKAYWETVLPSTVRAEIWDMQYFIFSDSVGLIFDFSETGNHQIVTTTETAVGLYSDKITDKLYYIKSDKIMEWEGGTTPLLMKWKTKDFQYPSPVFFTSARIIADSYGLVADTDVVLKVYAENVLVHTRTVRSDRAFKLPTLRPERRWSFAIESKYKITEIAVAGSMKELLQG